MANTSTYSPLACGLVLSLFIAAALAAVPPNIKTEIEAMKPAADAIIKQVMEGPAKGQAWNRLAELADTFGHRISGSDSLERAIDDILARLQAEGFDNVQGEQAMVPHWVRGREYATLQEPKVQPLAMLGLGSSIGTGPDGISAEVLVVDSFQDLLNKTAQAKGKIVVFNQYCDWVAKPVACYGETSTYRTMGATAAANAGAVASLIRTVGAFSINSPHTGIQFYTGKVKIPTACITIEDAAMLARMQARGQRIVINLYMEAQNLPDAPSRNIIADWTGSTYPDEKVVVSGHIDSWDVGVGAMDDGGGAFISWQAISLLKQLGLRPKRTIRLIMWTAEEQGGVGSQQYYNNHKANASLYDMVMESDMGVFEPTGIKFTGSPEATEIMNEISTLLAPINTNHFIGGGAGEDIAPWMKDGVPGASLANNNEKYFWFHHSWGDTMDVMNTTWMDQASATWAVTAYAVANLDDMLPRTNTSATAKAVPRRASAYTSVTIKK